MDGLVICCKLIRLDRKAQVKGLMYCICPQHELNTRQTSIGVLEGGKLHQDNIKRKNNQYWAAYYKLQPRGQSPH